MLSALYLSTAPSVAYAVNLGDADALAETEALAPAPIFGALPTAPKQAPLPDGQLFLELILNGRRTQQIIPVYLENGTVRLRPQDLQRERVNIHINGDTFYLSDIPGARFEYHVADQSLSIDLPETLLPNQHIGARRKHLQITPADTAFLLNYDAFVSSGLDGDKAQISVFLENRVAGKFGALSTSGLWRNGNRSGYKRYDTVFRTSHSGTATTWEVGDFITRNLSSASAVRLGGVQISRDFAVRPDIITYPMPRLSGRAALPSTVELLIDGRSIANANVEPGQFLFDTIPMGSGAGEAQLVVTDIHGRATTAVLPFYVSNNLLASGLTDFAVSAGFFREDFALKNFSYGNFAATASMRHGMSDALTAELRSEISDDFWLVGAGVQSRLLSLGILSASAAHSQFQGRSGHQMAFGYDYQAGAFSIALRHMHQSRHYNDLGTLDLIDHSIAHRQSLASISLATESWGSVGANYTQQKNEGLPIARYVNAHWSIPVHSRGQFYAQAGRDFTTKGWNVSLSLSITLGQNLGGISMGVADQSRGQRSYRADYSRSAPSDGGIGWNVGGSASQDGSKAWHADVLLRTQPVQYRFGGAGVTGGHRGNLTGGGQSFWAGASGGLVLMDGFLMAANQLPNSFAVVSTDGYANIPVRYEHQLIGRTNKKGRLFIPSVSPWYNARVSIDPLDLPPNIMVPQVEQNIAIEGGRGVHVRFHLRNMQPILAAIRWVNGDYMPAGSTVHADGKIIAHIGWDGLLYIEDMSAAPDGSILVTTPNNDTCFVSLPAAKLTPDNWNIGDLSCTGRS